MMADSDSGWTGLPEGSSMTESMRVTATKGRSVNVSHHVSHLHDDVSITITYGKPDGVGQLGPAVDQVTLRREEVRAVVDVLVALGLLNIRDMLRDRSASGDSLQSTAFTLDSKRELPFEIDLPANQAIYFPAGGKIRASSHECRVDMGLEVIDLEKGSLVGRLLPREG